MAEIIMRGDFVEIVFVGKLKETGDVVDTNIQSVAKEKGVFNENSIYDPVVAAIGAGQVLPGIEKALEGKGLGSYTIEMKPEEGFGKKNPQLIQLVPTSKFLSQDVRPIAGLRVDIDGSIGVVRTVAGGRAIVDFNHPLSGKDLVYEVTVNKIIKDDKEKLELILKKQFGFSDAIIEVNGEEAIVKIDNDIPQEVAAQFGQRILRMVPTFKKLSFKPKEKKE